ncbi:hypothetical protein CsSME_00041731 [Camellia sinensis var. sinensis]
MNNFLGKAMFIMFLILVSNKSLEVTARPFDGTKLTVASGGGGGHGRSLLAPTRKDPKSPPAPSPCTNIPGGGGHCNNH